MRRRIVHLYYTLVHSLYHRTYECGMNIWAKVFLLELSINWVHANDKVNTEFSMTNSWLRRLRNLAAWHAFTICVVESVRSGGMRATFINSRHTVDIFLLFFLIFRLSLLECCFGHNDPAILSSEIVKNRIVEEPNHLILWVEPARHQVAPEKLSGRDFYLSAHCTRTRTRIPKTSNYMNCKIVFYSSLIGANDVKWRCFLRQF